MYQAAGPLTVNEESPFTNETTVMTSPLITPTLSDPLTIQVGGLPGMQICPAMREQVLVYNNDLTNIVYVGNGNTSGLGLTNTVPVQPLTQVVLDARKGLSAFCPTGSISVTVVPGGTYISPSPAQVAAQIALGGVGLLNNNKLSTLLGFPTGITVPVGSPFTITLPNQTGTSYAGNMLFWSAANAFAQVDIGFTDNVGNELAHETWFIAPGADISHTHNIHAIGPLVASQMILTVTAFVNSVQFIISLYQNSLTPERHDWRSAITMTTTNNTGVIIPTTAPNALELFILPSTAFTTGLTNTYLLPLFAGRVRIWGFLAGGAAGDMGFALNNYANRTAVIGNQQVWGAKSDSSGNISTEFSLSRSQCTLAITNNNAATKNIEAAILIEEY